MWTASESMNNLRIQINRDKSEIHKQKTSLVFYLGCKDKNKDNNKKEEQSREQTCVRPDVLDVVALAVGEVGALAAGVQFAGEVIPQMFPPVVLTYGGVWTQSALKHPEETQQQQRNVLFNRLLDATDHI